MTGHAAPAGGGGGNKDDHYQSTGSPHPVYDTSSASQEASENLRRALRVNEATNRTGYATLQSLGQQRETIQHSIDTVGVTNQHLQDSRQVIRDIRWSVYKEWILKGGVIAVLVLLIILIFWSKFLRHKGG